MDEKSASHLSDVNDMEQHAKYTIFTMNEEKSDSLSKQYLQDIQEKLSILYEEFRIWLEENQESEKLSGRMDALKAESDKLLQLAKHQVQKLKDNENLKEAMDKGSRVVSDTTLWVGGTICNGFDEVMKNEKIQQVGNKFDEIFQQIRSDDRVKKSVKTLKKETLKCAESALSGMRKVLDTEESEIEEHDNEKNNNL